MTPALDYAEIIAEIPDGYWERLEQRLTDEKIPPDDPSPDPEPLF